MKVPGDASWRPFPRPGVSGESKVALFLQTLAWECVDVDDLRSYIHTLHKVPNVLNQACALQSVPKLPKVFVGAVLLFLAALFGLEARK